MHTSQLTIDFVMLLFKGKDKNSSNQSATVDMQAINDTATI